MLILALLIAYVNKICYNAYDMTASQPGFVPKEVFNEHLRFFPIATFDLLVQLPDQDDGIALLRRRIAPYAGKWALPGLRMLKGESIDDTLQRIAERELGVGVDTDSKQLVGQYVGNFRTEQGRQDISTGYLVQAAEDGIEIQPNGEHFSGLRVIHSMMDVPKNTGAMYKYYLDRALAKES